MPWWRSLHFKVTLYQILLLAGMLGSTFAIMFTVERLLLVEKGQNFQEQMGNRIVSNLLNRIYLTESLTSSLANLGERLDPDESVYKQVVPHILDYEGRESFIAGGGIWPESYEFDPEVQRRSFFWGREPDGSLKYYDDYNDPKGAGYHQEEWYVPATHYKPGEAYWSKSYMDPYSLQPMVTCSVPMWRQDKMVGVATVDLKLEGLKNFLDEASNLLGGYMFIVDRNNKFLAFPKTQMVTRKYRDDANNPVQEFLNARDLAEADPKFMPITDALDNINLRMVEAAKAQNQDFEQLASQIAEQSYQINEEEARCIVASMMNQTRSQTAETMEVSRLFLDHTPLLNEPVMVSIFQMPQTHWKIIAVTPMSKFYASADSATWKIGSYVMALELAALLTMFLLVRKVLIRPLRDLSDQVRQSSEHGGQLHQHLDDSSQNELGQLAYEFNRRSDHLVNTMDELHEARDDLESRVAQRTAELETVLSELENHKLAMDVHLITSISDIKGNITYANDNFCKISGYTHEELIGHNHRIVKSDEHPPEFFRDLWKTLAQGKIWHGELKNLAKDGGYYWVDATMVPFKDEHGKTFQYIAIRTDITAIKEAQNKLRLSAEHDRLTDLPNRELFNTRLQQAIHHAKTDPDFKFAILFFDFDRFKVINDSLGHNVGDALLIDIARQFNQILRNDDTAARFGGDEFVVLLNDLNSYEEASQTADRLLKTFAKTRSLMGHAVTSTASIGLVTNQRGYDLAEDMIRDADTAMYQAKEAGKNCVAVFDQKMYIQALNRLVLESDLRNALELNQFYLVYQPIVNLDTGQVSGFEALLRWDHPKRGIISPVEFIPIAEDTGLIIDIGRWVLQNASQQLAQWNRTLGLDHHLTMNVNVSKRQLLSSSVLTDALQCVQDYQLQPRDLKLEVTESTIADDRSNVVPLLHELRVHGFPIVLDDFGTGVSSLGALHDYPIDVLKIDHAFIRVLDRDRSLLAIVASITSLADNLGILTVAEGIETPDIIGALQSINCTWGQGYHFAKPLSPADAKSYLLGLKDAAEPA